MATVQGIKGKLIDKIQTLASGASSRDLNFLSKSLENLNSEVREDTFNSETGELNRFTAQNIPRLPINNGTQVDAGRQSSNVEFGVFTQYSETIAYFGTLDEKFQNMKSSRWSWCHHYQSGSNVGGSYSYWSSAQRHQCHSWQTNPCHFGCDDCTTSNYCYNGGTDQVGDLGNATFVGGPSGAFSTRYWGEPSRTQALGQITNIGPRHEFRNEQCEIGNAEVGDKFSYLIYNGQDVILKNRRFLPGAGTGANYSSKGTGNGNVSSYGSLTHNADRGELAVLNRKDAELDGYNRDKYIFATTIYKNCPVINLKTNLSTYLSETGKVTALTVIEDADTGATAQYPTTSYTDGGDSTAFPHTVASGIDNAEFGTLGHEDPYHGTSYANYTSRAFYHPSNYNENWQGMKICMTDNGDIYWSVMNRWAHSLQMCKRYTVNGVTDDTYYESVFVPRWSPSRYTLNIKGYDEHRNHNTVGYEPLPRSTTRVMDWHWLREARGREDDGGDHPNGNSRSPGHAIIQSRTKKNVVMKTPYYYYCSGVSAWVIDKRFNRWFTMAYWREQNHGAHIAAFGREGFVCSLNRDVAADNITYKLYSFRQDPNSGEWFQSEHATNLGHCFPGVGYAHPSLVPFHS
ncbi:MAG TPA: hypothetical protein DGM69_07495 [Chloroflexi bacterium]|nr:hypothetical protein [Chloroflexota bacterium]|tara:strand:- start:381 stop:2267 length:1887 start_codon:yes stop_codon:yes gene_type:complete